MPLTTDQVFRAASDAVVDLHRTHGDGYHFPFDEIWEQTAAAQRIPSERRPGPRRRLMIERYIEPTGAMTSARSEARAGSPTTEYRFGTRLIAAVAQPAPAVTGLSVADNLVELHRRLEAQGYVFSQAELANFYLAMAISPLVILSGTSGTGKSLLPRAFAKETGSLFFSIAVQPQWSDNADLFGHVPTLAPNTYWPGKLISPLLAALADPSQLVVVLLDEMNLAPVEHYFSDFLSVVESRRRASGKIITDALPLTLPTAVGGDWDKLRDAYLPPNLRIVGTANMDETTRTFSPKVLDRAFTLEFDDADLLAFSDTGKATAMLGFLEPLTKPLLNQSDPLTVHEARTSSEVLFDHIAVLLSQIQSILAPAGVRFGYRSRDAVLMYIWRWKHFHLNSLLTDNAALDFCILQKILPRVTGTGEHLNDALGKLATWLERDRTGSADSSPEGFNGPFVRSAAKTRRMLSLLESEGATHFWGV